MTSNFHRDIPEEYRPLIQQAILNLLLEDGIGELAQAQPLPHEVNAQYDQWLKAQVSVDLGPNHTTLLRALALKYGTVSSSGRILADGQVTVNGTPVTRKDHPVYKGDTIQVSKRQFWVVEDL